MYYQLWFSFLLEVLKGFQQLPASATVSCKLSINMASTPLPVENGKDDTLHSSGPLSMPSHMGPDNSSELSQAPPPFMQDELTQAGATLIPPLASYHPMATFLTPYMPSYSVPLSCLPPVNGGPNVSTAEVDLDMEEEKKPDKEHKKRSKNWTRPETLRLIKYRTDLASKFSRTGRKSDLWDQIASALHQEHISRDAQQCRDKWEKLMAGYKEVRDGAKDKEDNPYYEELHPLLSGKLSRRDQHDVDVNDVDAQQSPLVACGVKDIENEGPSTRPDAGSDEDEDCSFEERPYKRKRSPKDVPVTDLQAVQTMLEMVISQQQKIFKDFLDTLERKEQLREQLRQEREEKWRVEELAHGRVLNDAMIVLTQKLVGERVGAAPSSSSGYAVVGNPLAHEGAMKRSKNWKRREVLQLIKLRGEMEAQFSKSTSRAALWDELSDILATQGIKRDGKQCREKWDKLMAEHKDVIDGKREQGDSPYFQELSAVVGIRSRDVG